MTPEERKTWVRQMGARQDWWDSRQEDAIEPGWEIVDAHIHLWDEREFPDPSGHPTPLVTSPYLLPQLRADMGSGHKVSHCVYVECGSRYLIDGPERLRPVGEASFAADLASQLMEQNSPTHLGAVVAHADLADPALGEVLDAYESTSGGLVRGIRQSGARLEDPSARLLAGAAPQDRYAGPDFLRGLASLGERRLTFDAFLFHFQLDTLAELALQAPSTIIIVNHTGAPIGYSGKAGPGDPTFDAWARQLDRIADFPNIVMKLGGLASIVTGYDAHRRARPPSSEEFVAERSAYFRHAIRRFGAERCMFESNFPVDSPSISYPVLWNAYKLMAGEHDPPARQALLSGTARKVYRIDEQPREAAR